MMKKKIKRVADILMRGMSFPLYLQYRILCPVAGRRRAFASVMQMVSLVPGISGEWLRRGVLQWVTGTPLTDCCISFGTLFSDPDICIGNGVYIGARCDIGRASIGENTIIGSQVHITSGLHQHRFDRTDIPIRDQQGRFAKVLVGRDVWIGNGALICADIGHGSVIGAGSVVVKPVPEFSVFTCEFKPVIKSRMDK